MMQTDRSSYRLEDFLSDESFLAWLQGQGDADTDFWERYGEIYPQNKPAFQEAKELGKRLGGMALPPLPNGQQAAAKARLMQRLDNPSEQGPTLAKRRFLPLWAVRAAAAVLLVLGGVGLWRFWSGPIGEPRTSQPVAEARMEKSTPRGVKSKITLPDGSTVKLNSETRLILPDSLFSGSERLVYLEGEAFFEVARDTMRPFRIVTEALTTTVLGTSFSVTAYQGEAAQVAVATGKVAVRREGQADAQAIVLLPNQQATLTGNGLEKGSFDPAELWAWRDGILLFNRAKWPQIENRLERWYGVELVWDKRLENNVYTGRFENESLKNILEALRFTTPFQYQIRGDSVFVF